MAVTMAKQSEQHSGLLYGLVNRMIILALLILLTFLLPRLMPGDPVDMLISSDVARDLSAAERTALQVQMGLNAPLWEQFGGYVLGILKGDLGYSAHHAAPVTSLLASALPWTGLLIILSLPVFLIVGVGLGIEAGQRPHRRLDHAVTGLMTLFASLPPFAVAVLLLAVFGFLWPLFPASGAEPLFPSDDLVTNIFEILYHAALPALALAAHEIVRFYYLSRGEAMKLSVRPFVINAYARGITGWRARIHYYGRNLLPVLLARLSDSLSTLVSTVLYVEIVFSYPGIGTLLYGAILERDFVLLQGVILGLATCVLMTNWGIDVVVSSLAERG